MKAIVGEDDQSLRNTLERIIARPNDEGSEKSLGYLLAGVVIGVRMVPVSAGAAFLESEDVIERCSGFDQLQGTSICNVGDMESMPVNRRSLGKTIPEVHDDLVSLVRLEERTRNAAVIGIAGGSFSGNERKQGGLCCDCHFDRV